LLGKSSNDHASILRTFVQRGYGFPTKNVLAWASPPSAHTMWISENGKSDISFANGLVIVNVQLESAPPGA